MFSKVYINLERSYFPSSGIHIGSGLETDRVPLGEVPLFVNLVFHIISLQMIPSFTNQVFLLTFQFFPVLFCFCFVLFCFLFSFFFGGGVVLFGFVLFGGCFFFGGGGNCSVRCLSMIVWTPAAFGVLYECVLYFCICTCSAQLSMFHMEWHSRNMLIIIIIIDPYVTHGSKLDCN